MDPSGSRIDSALWYLWHPANPVKKDLFAFGSAIYEMATKAPTDKTPDDLASTHLKKYV